MNKQLITFKSIIIIAVIIAVIDQYTKYLVIEKLKISNVPVKLAYIFQLRLVKNTGAAFNLLSNNTTFLSFLSLIVAISIIFWLWYNQPLILMRGLGMGFLLGGTIGNGLDRFRLGFVIDFIEVKSINFPIFNLADISINIAILFFLLDSIRRKK